MFEDCTHGGLRVCVENLANGAKEQIVDSIRVNIASVDRQIDITAWGKWLEDGLRDHRVERGEGFAITRERGDRNILVDMIGLLPG